MTKSLLIAPQWIGDAVMTQPLMAQLQARGERLTVAALPWVAPIYEAMPECEQVLVLPFKRGSPELLNRWRWARSIKGQFDRAYVCPNTFKSALLALWAGIAVRVGYVGEMRRCLLTQSLPNPNQHERTSMVAFYTALALDGPLHPVALGVDVVGMQTPAQPRLHVSSEATQSALQAHGLKAQGFIVLAPGAEYGAAKRWPAHYAAQLCAALQTPVVLLGSDKDRGIAQEILGAVRELTASGVTPSVGRGHVVDLTGRTTLLEAMALIASARGVVSNDSGLMHVAASLGTPQVALFGSSSPLHTPPLSDQAQVLWLKTQGDYGGNVDCAPCFKRTCPLEHFRCMNDLSVKRVLPLVQVWDAPAAQWGGR